MGFLFRRSIRIGPVRLNISRRGIGASIGVRGLRTGVSSTGRRYTRVSLPGTGLGYEHTHQASPEAEPRPEPSPAEDAADEATLGWLAVLTLAAVMLYFFLSA